MTEVTKLTVDYLGEVMISMMEHSNMPWGVKDNQSRFVYLNKAGLDMNNIPAGFDFEGRLDEEFPCAWAELAPEIRAQDRKAETSHQTAEIICTSYFTRDSVLEPWYFPKIPIYNPDGESLGTIFYGKKFSFISLCDFFNNLKPSIINLNPPVDTFTEKELDIIFYALQKLSSKDIATKLSLSHRTVENRLQKIYEKMEVNSLAGFIEYCHTNALNNYVPKKFLRQGIEFFW
ncbi:helix-turn-helix transcriptional regulator [Candidatus Williamhamiltonella defendens]|nr:helix-turn-helix transcriptional regulator [Candidatus Hamiltonella defensa]ATW22470.1 helix-turn-helix transcriptional regulator [Candidatus Hamiltonella defensa]